MTEDGGGAGFWLYDLKVETVLDGRTPVGWTRADRTRADRTRVDRTRVDRTGARWTRGLRRSPQS